MSLLLEEMAEESSFAFLDGHESIRDVEDIGSYYYGVKADSIILGTWAASLVPLVSTTALLTISEIPNRAEFP